MPASRNERPPPCTCEPIGSAVMPVDRDALVRH
jgi:hypothetical protein